MDARERLYYLLKETYSPTEAKVVTDEIINLALSEAAQKIRSDVADMDGWPEEQHVARKYADLIDPDKEKP